MMWHGIGPSKEGVVIKTPKTHSVWQGAKISGQWSRRELGRGASNLGLTLLSLSHLLPILPISQTQLETRGNLGQPVWLQNDLEKGLEGIWRGRGKLSSMEGSYNCLNKRLPTKSESQFCHKLCVV